MDQRANAPASSASKAKRGTPGAKKNIKLRGLPTDSERVRISKTISYLLRHGAQSAGLPMRPDGFVRVTDLLAQEKLRTLDFPALERIVQDDAKQRYALVHEPGTDEPGTAIGDAWWIRANQGHSMQEVELDLKPIASAADIPMAVHGTTLTAWNSIQRNGLSKGRRNHIHLAQGVPGSGIISGMRNTSQVLIYIDIEKALQGGISFELSDNGVVLSKGNAQGFIPPIYFERVERADGTPLPDGSSQQKLRSEAARTIQEDA